MDISLGIIAFNEEKNIVNLLNSIDRQETGGFSIKEIILVLGGCKDKTYEKARSYKGRYKEVLRIIVFNERRGKYHDINVFLKNASSKILVLSSADIILAKFCLKNITLPFNDKNIGVVSSRIIPLNGGADILTRIIRMQWDIHDKISLRQPKFGEIIAFRNIVGKINPTSADEELIAGDIIKKGYSSFYAKKAVAYNKGPKSFRELVIQRRRIFCGHLEIKRKYGYEASSMKTKNIIFALKKIIWKYPFYIILIGFLVEFYSRILGRFDYLTDKKKHYKWKIAESTK